jgi:8-oxoguanine deaminase
MSLGQADGGLPPQQTVQQGEVILADSQRLIRQYHERGAGARIQIALAPCSPFSVTPEIMRQSAKLAEELDVRLHTHLAETLDEEDFCLQRFGLRTVDYLDSVGWLGPRTWLAHGIHFNPEEIARLGQAGTGICHCPSSNMRLASGICPTLDLVAAGAPIGLGVDGSASNDASNLILEARQALYLQRLRYGAEKITPQLVLAGPPRARHACSGARTSASWRSASRRISRCSSSTSYASPAATIRSPPCCCAAPTAPTGC